VAEARTALVTGASRGIGRAVAFALARQGARVVVHYGTRRDAAEAVRDAIAAAGGEAIAVGADMADDAGPGILAEEALRFGGGRVDILVNNAGVRQDGLFAMAADAALARVLQVNLLSPMRLTRLLVREMLKVRWGRIVNVASGAGVTGNAGQASYAASKGGLIAFSRSLGRELGSYGVLVNAVAPGLVDTDMVAGMNADARDRLVAQIPQGRLGTPEEVASVVAFLCGDGAGYVNGQLIQVNGGLVT
jgi:3-oxoacyl-[acyl-carrier protein] reductase